jgi:tRNA dimethylallyltransferase
MDKQRLAIICGPTASGKTRLAVAAALHFGGEVVSADSMQVYCGMDIGTAKPTAEEMRSIPHHMLNCVGVGEAYSAAAYREQARACIADIGSRGKLPILCGGTGLYISAVVYPLDFANAGADEGLRAELQAFAQEHGTTALYEKLKQADPEAAAAIHPNNVRRVIRAMERAKASGTESAAGQALFNSEPLYDLAWVGLTMDRKDLYRRIDARVDGMIKQGLLDEVRRLATKYPRNSIAFQALGYKELLGCIEGKTTLEEAITQIKTGTRNYAKRQMTWFRREALIRWFDTVKISTQEELDTAVFGYIQATLHITGT